MFTLFLYERNVGEFGIGTVDWKGMRSTVIVAEANIISIQWWSWESVSMGTERKSDCNLSLNFVKQKNSENFQKKKHS